MDELGNALGASATGLYLFGPDGNVAVLHARGVREGFILAYEQLGRGADPILERALATGCAAHDDDVFRGDCWPRSPLYRACGGPWKIRHYLCAPIVSDGATIGTLNLGRASAAHPFGASDVSAASALARTIGGRLAALARDDADEPPRRASMEALGRLSADRTHVRIRAVELERDAPPLSATEADGLWDALVSRHVTPLDYFERGDRTYVLFPASALERSSLPAMLTPREAEIVARAAAGLANKEIAFELGISQHTVAAALSAARKKLGVASRVKLVEAARRRGLVP